MSPQPSLSTTPCQSTTKSNHLKSGDHRQAKTMCHMLTRQVCPMHQQVLYVYFTSVSPFFLWCSNNWLLCSSVLMWMGSTDKPTPFIIQCSYESTVKSNQPTHPFHHPVKCELNIFVLWYMFLAPTFGSSVGMLICSTCQPTSPHVKTCTNQLTPTSSCQVCP